MDGARGTRIACSVAMAALSDDTDGGRLGDRGPGSTGYRLLISEETQPMDPLTALYLRGAIDLFLVMAGCSGIYLMRRRRGARDRW